MLWFSISMAAQSHDGWNILLQNVVTFGINNGITEKVVLVIEGSPNMKPDFNALMQYDGFIIVTAKTKNTELLDLTSLFKKLSEEFNTKKS